jgi:hypothetical protein
MQFLPFDDLKKNVRDLGITSFLGYRARYKEIPGAPCNPERAYAGKGWGGCRDLFGLNVKENRHGSQRCEHGRHRPYCRECGGSGFCVHKRHRHHCRECGGNGYCEHGRQRHTCKECGGSQICEHARRRAACKECGTYYELLANGFTKEQVQSMSKVRKCEYPGCQTEASDRGLNADHAHGQPCENSHHYTRRPCPECFRGNICHGCNVNRLRVVERFPKRANENDLEYVARRPLNVTLAAAA